MKTTPISTNLVDTILKELQIEKIGKASIRQIVKLVNEIEKASGVPFIRMEMGVPGISATQIGVDAEIKALDSGVASIYPSIEGIPEVKKEISRFVKLFLDVDVSENSCVPTVGSMQGAYASFLALNRRHKDRQTTLFIDPGFPVQKAQLKTLGLPFKSFDVYNYRNEKLKDKLLEIIADGTISSIIYSNPNNPSWICFTENELKTIAEVANKYDIVVIEDLAYFGMDFREDYGNPGVAPYQPSIAKYTDNYFLLISSSKVFSYAGQRIASLVISDKLFNQKFENLIPYFGMDTLGQAVIYGALYTLSSGTSHASQFALAAMLKAVNNGEYKFLDYVKVYQEKAKLMKKIFVENGFSIVYDKDIDKELADGFYFTISYKGLSSEDLLHRLLYFGISAISLDITGSERKDGLRACTSTIKVEQLPELANRLKIFNNYTFEKC